MKLTVGAPVAERAWILPSWFECLGKQTLQPNAFCFVYSESRDDTKEILHQACPKQAELLVSETRLPYHSRGERNSDPKDPHRAEHMAKLRNKLRGLFMQTDADIFLSLDTDILLEDPTTLEQLVHTLQEGWDLVAPLTYLHPWGAHSRCHNAGWLTGGEGYTQAWRRAELGEVLAYKPPLKIDVPLAAYVIRRHPMGMCRYAAHECGEDIGFAQNFARYGYRAGWRTDLEVRHVWDQLALKGEGDAVDRAGQTAGDREP